MATKTQRPVKAETKDPNKTTKNTIKKNDSPKKILEVLKSTKNALIIMDSRFDYDALGSVLAFSDALKQLNTPHKCIYGYEIPAKPKEYFDTERIQEDVDLKAFDYTLYDLLIFLDSGTLEHHTKAGDYKPPENIPTLNIDHHAGNSSYGSLNYVLNRASTGSILFELFKEWKIQTDQKLLNYLLVSIVTDTGIFQLNNTTPTEMRIVAELIERGADYNGFIEFLTNHTTRDELAVKAIIYSNLKIDNIRKFAYSYILREESDEKAIKEKGTISADSIKTLIDINFAFVIETDASFPDVWRISLRSHSLDYNVLKIAQKFGGGGHKVAAGCTIPFYDAKTVEEVVEKIWQVASGIKNAS